MDDTVFFNGDNAADITMPGVFTIPICSWAELWTNWYAATVDKSLDSNYPTFPCNKV